MLVHPFAFPAWLESAHHDGSASYVSNPYPAFGETVTLRLRTGSDAPVRRVFIRTCPDGEQFFQAMQPLEATPPVQWWQGELSATMPAVNYRFVIEAEDGVWWLTAAGVSLAEPRDDTDFCLLADYAPVPWLKDAVFYQVYPDRFANGDPGNDPQPQDFTYLGHPARTLPWGAPLPDETSRTTTFYGGDLPGITAHLDYIEDLGVNALYLNPVFAAYSSHRYDAITFEHVDPHLGGDDALIALREALSARGMRYLLDITPNHCGLAHPWFQAAQADPHVPEAEFFHFTDHPAEYASWLGFKALPKFNYASEALRRRIYAGEDAIFRRWLRPPFAADGWRVDVANMTGRLERLQVGGEVARGIRAAVKAARPDAYLMGENFHDATPQLQGDQWDGVMNYMGFAIPLWHWLRGYQQGAIHFHDEITSPAPYPTATLAATWLDRLGAVPWAVALQQFNLLGSHDTHRIRSLVGENDALHRLAVVLLMTFPGVPCVLYGDEIGLVDVPVWRGIDCMTWDDARWDHALRAFYKDLIVLRRRSDVLQCGGFQLLAVEPDTLAYQREGAAGRVIVVAQRSASGRAAGPLPVAHGGVPDRTRFV
ncbi:MAG: maltodextrin glucosidase, partial [Anaerolineae bacterium]|nr:maltodextrin glucosidase [Anaerolineae bacterium]